MSWQDRIASWSRHHVKSERNESQPVPVADAEADPGRPRPQPNHAVVDNAVYCEGERLEPESLERTYELIRERKGLGWIGLYRPEPEDVVTRAQAREISADAAAVVSAGRPRCTMCGQPMSPEGHTCPHMNGHLPLVFDTSDGDDDLDA